MAFVFRFDRMMKINESEKKVLERQYNEVYALLEEQGKKLIDLMQRKEKLQEQFETKKRQRVRVADVIDQTFLLQKIGHHIIEEQHRYNQMRVRVEQFHQKLMEKSIELKKFEKLKSIQQDNYAQLEKQKENKVMDEKAAINYFRQ
ncbi:flagellar FliJ protein [Pullulanibacillus pueri]|uniref:Flagellar FliJ protein n=1 Tax=Pullulanibacillus pueri TaxID=1437324 RepID=A0A8J3EM87_9BACL|nr:flagellar export protein FliJ [Pullulanibacillus pueri]MBM7682478.1 flagellar FliJ protein [Pullulanibacillus pueri]GGH82238.1 flagellar FliJ protein [Pullulanibacillus pueri]